MKGLKVAITAAVIGSLISTASAQEKVVSEFYYDGSDKFIEQFNNTLLTQAKNLGLKVEQYDGKKNASLQLEQIEKTSGQNSPMLINMVDSHFAYDVVMKARQNNRRIVFFNRKPDAQAVADYPQAWYVGSVPQDSGRMQGELVRNYIQRHSDWDRNGNGKLDVLVIKGEANHDDTEMRTQAALFELNKSGISFKVVDSMYANWSADQAYTAMKSAIKKYGMSGIDVVISNNDAMALGVLKALNEYDFNLAGITDRENFVPVFGVDALPEAVKAVQEGRLAGTVCNDYNTMARVALILASEETTDPIELSKKVGFMIHDGFVNIPYKKLSVAVSE